MSLCKYCEEYNSTRYTYDRYTGACDGSYTVVEYRCLGTREKDPCNYNGDITKCKEYNIDYIDKNKLLKTFEVKFYDDTVCRYECGSLKTLFRKLHALYGKESDTDLFVNVIFAIDDNKFMFSDTTDLWIRLFNKFVIITDTNDKRIVSIKEI